MDDKQFQEKFTELRKSTGMSRKDFCEYFNMSYRTVTDWERGERHAPEYVYRLLAYYIRMQQLTKENAGEIPFVEENEDGSNEKE